MLLIYHNFSQVVKDRKWKEVTMIFKYPSTITSASFVLRKYYQSLLYHFEQVYYFRKKNRPVLATGTCILTLPIHLFANVSYPIDLNIKVGPFCCHRFSKHNCQWISSSKSLGGQCYCASPFRQDKSYLANAYLTTLRDLRLFSFRLMSKFDIILSVPM